MILKTVSYRLEALNNSKVSSTGSIEGHNFHLLENIVLEVMFNFKGPMRI